MISEVCAWIGMALQNPKGFAYEDFLYRYVERKMFLRAVSKIKNMLVRFSLPYEIIYSRSKKRYFLIEMVYASID